MLARWNPWRGLAGLPARLWLLFAVTLINRAGTMVLPFLALWLTRERGFSAGRAGAYFALYGLTGIAAAPLAGRLADRFRPLPVLVAALLTSGAVLLVFPLARHPAALALAVVAFAAGSETFRPASLAAITAWTTPAERRMGFSLSRLAINLGMSVGPAVGGFLAAWSFRALFAVDAVTSLLAGAVLLLAAPRVPAGLAAQAPASPAAGARRANPLTDRRFLLFLLPVALVFIVFFQHEAAMPVYLVRDLGLSPATYGLMFTVNTLLIVALEVPLNARTALWPFRRSLTAGALLCGIGFGGMALAHGVPGFAATVVVWTFAEMILLPSAAAYAAHLAPGERQGSYMGAYSMIAALGFSVGPWLGLKLLDAWGGRTFWSATFVVAAVAALLFSRLVDDAAYSG
ncbi:MAG TPA: MFS transporter [Thermoanaerobaculia bacterium]|nr:MFS transporter [Thermoanaerobaculia bacterium]